ncbi:MAG: GNAT family N-acetyltransferase [Actinomycetaceae bacterium]|nr:GNAT family N-acetyltransferase [Actinomycetaceae bacterium]
MEKRLRGDGFVLDQPHENDFAQIVDACNDSEIMKWTRVPHPYSWEQAKNWVDEYVPGVWADGGYSWVIRPDFAGKVWGAFELRKVADRENAYEVGLWVAPKNRGRGLSREVFHFVASCVEKTSEIIWKTYVGNEASQKVAQALGLDFWGTATDLDEAMPPLLVFRGLAYPRVGIMNPRDGEALVKQFHEVYGLPVLTDGPRIPEKRVAMRLSLILEEATELVRSVYGKAAENILSQAISQLPCADEGERDLVETADALADLVYVTYGMALECGINLPAVLQEVQISNLSKLGEDGKPIYREDGKVLKGPGFFPPNIEKGLSVPISGLKSTEQN